MGTRTRQLYAMVLRNLPLAIDLLDSDGSIYVHLDWHVAHYAKTILDEVFGYENFLMRSFGKRFEPPKPKQTGTGMYMM